MANLSLRHIYKVYPNGAKAVSDFNMDIEDNEFIVFVGPSGCGKSTTLRMIAGLEEITAGELYIGDELVNNVEPKDRDISMVFQNYALYPHMTVYDNMAFGLKLRHVPQTEIHQKVLWAANALKLTEYLDRKPRAMSGGQRQRVALGRAILRNPKVFLLDEPLSNLDAKLRTEMRAEIAKLHNTLKTTFIYVTHDQVEAMTLGTRVVVMKLGFIQQIDTPQNLYNYPENKFVAGFIGTPQMSFFDCFLKKRGENVVVTLEKTNNQIVVPLNDVIKVDQSYLYKEKKVCLGIRCEDVSIDPEIVSKSKNKIKMKISHFEELGNETLVYGDLNLENEDLGDNSTSIIVKSYKGGLGLRSGDVVDVAFNMKKAHFFDAETEETICSRVPSINTFGCHIKNNVLEVLGSKINLPDAIKVDDADDAEILVPVDAIRFDGNIKAEVVKVEEVNSHKVFYLQNGDRLFFTVDSDLKIKDKVNISIDLEKISIIKDGQVIVKPLVEYSKFVGSFTNFENDKLAVKSILSLKENELKCKIANLTNECNIELSKIGLSGALVSEVKKEYQDKVNEAKTTLSKQLGTLDLTKDRRRKLIEKNDLYLKDLKDEYKAKLDEIKASKNKEVSDDIKQQGNEISEKYSLAINKLKDEFEGYKSIVLSGSNNLKSFALDDIKSKNDELENNL